MVQRAGPENVSQSLVAYLDAGDIDGIMNLYEDDAVFADFDGAATGSVAIRAAHERFVAEGLRLTLRESAVFEADSIALVQWAWTVTNRDGSSMEGASAEVLRKQTDGSWKFLIDNSDGAALIGRI